MFKKVGIPHNNSKNISRLTELVSSMFPIKTVVKLIYGNVGTVNSKSRTAFISDILLTPQFWLEFTLLLLTVHLAKWQLSEVIEKSHFFFQSDSCWNVKILRMWCWLYWIHYVSLVLSHLLLLCVDHRILL